VILDIFVDWIVVILGRILVLVAVMLISTVTILGFAVVLPTVTKFGTLWFGFNLLLGKEMKHMQPII
jgi:hypothetical protein